MCGKGKMNAFKWGRTKKNMQTLDVKCWKITCMEIECLVEIWSHSRYWTIK